MLSGTSPPLSPSPSRRGGGIKKRGLRPLLKLLPPSPQGKGVRGMGAMLQGNET